MGGDDALNQRRREERKQMLILDAKKGGLLHFIDAKWVKCWFAFTKGGKVPGPILHKNLLDGNLNLKPGLEVFKHYRTFNSEQGDYLLSIYGGDPPLKSQTRSIYLSELKFHDSENLSEASTKPNHTSSSQSLLPFQVRKGLVGLRNPHYFCYMNSALQGLLSITAFRDYFLYRRYEAVTNASEKPLSNLLASLTTAIFKLDEGIITPKPLWQHVMRAFPLDSQHDLADFLSYILEELERELLNELGVPIITSLFIGETCSSLKCYNCMFESTTREPFSMIILSLQSSLDQALSFFTSEEGIPSGFKCRGCKSVGNITKRMSFIKLPRVLVFQIKRFEQYPQLRKLEGFIKFKLKMSHPCFKESYKLVAVIVHSGTISGGHYTAYTKRSHRWFFFNDDQVKKVALKEVLKQEAYCLLYSIDSKCHDINVSNL
mmetsp:Transcript_13224/g.24767  ORF Transcript_13224/g.24767 Transcript_13224/m.24767 type:complete len:432 (+) Transcript_13224:160-1455(+)|eukprot:CAMPEP_0204896956 /NCGR_PEP_ID=MMETSP1397-20131031/466_1 /ASSEMBLY_ACC=CAM_ASM_000891 /TAXON_ID=49980 /ORGANISM="Climacostomum Climacostomum virens, Strain Stock W-24" /LENGTH=431 /DNA_ID=CAMNT_0052064651 /DNA_START=127 /DNA_END=1422 /DNA_ORIENTATION=+